MSDVLSHPLALVFVGAVVSGLLIPYVTRRWQNHQKELELKVALLGDVSDTVTRVITHAWFRELAGKKELSEADRQEFNWQYGEWEVKTRVIESQLRAYFPQSEIADHWGRYCNLLRELHHLSWERMNRQALLAKLKRTYEANDRWCVTAEGGRVRRARSFCVDDLPRNIDWDAFVNTEDRPKEGGPPRYMTEAWWPLKTAMEAPLVPLTRAILHASVESL